MKSAKFNYTAIQICFWMAYTVFICFAAVYLQDVGYSNTVLGLILALGYLFGFLFSTAFSSLIDRYEKIRSVEVFNALILLQGISLVFMILFPEKGIVNAAAFTATMTFLESGTSINTRLYLELQESGYAINYGAARGIGSLGFTIASFVMGGLVEKYSTKVLLIASAILLVIRLLLNLSAMNVLNSGTKTIKVENEKVDHPAAQSVFSLLKSNPRFMILLIGITLVFVDHASQSSFLINIVRNVGGDTADMGKISAFRAILEVPMMLLYNRIRNRFSVFSLMKFSLLLFIAKAAAIFAAGNIPALYLALLLQPFSYAIFLLALVDYVGLVIPPEDSTKGQTLSYGATIVGSIICSFLDGRLYDLYPVKTVLLISTGICTAGVLIALVTVQKDGSAHQQLKKN